MATSSGDRSFSLLRVAARRAPRTFRSFPLAMSAMGRLVRYSPGRRQCFFSLEDQA